MTVSSPPLLSSARMISRTTRSLPFLLRIVSTVTSEHHGCAARCRQPRLKDPRARSKETEAENRTGLHHGRNAVVEKLGNPDRPVRIRAVERVNTFMFGEVAERRSKQFCSGETAEQDVSFETDAAPSGDERTRRARPLPRQVGGMLVHSSPSTVHPSLEGPDHVFEPADRAVQLVVHAVVFMPLLQEQGRRCVLDEVVLRRSECREVRRRGVRYRVRERARNRDGRGGRVGGGGGGGGGIPMGQTCDRLHGLVCVTGSVRIYHERNAVNALSKSGNAENLERGKG